MQPIKRETISRTIRWAGIYFLMAQYNRIATVDFTNSLPQVTNQFIQSFVLSSGREIAIEVADEANAERDVIEIVAVDVASGELNYPPIADLDLAITGRSPISNDKMISKAIRHAPDVPMIIIKYPGVTLASSTVVHHDIFPAIPGDARVIDRPAHGWS